jgi:phage repressor protein C with HTH and peptisase S24 domain
MPLPRLIVQANPTVEIAEFNVACGLGATYIHDDPAHQTMRTFSRTWVRQFTSAPIDQLFWATSSGTSMMPAILDSDILLIDTTQKSPKMWDQFWAIEMHGLGMIKSCARPRMAEWLVSVNPDFRDEIAYDGEMNVIGRVVAIVRKV